MTPQYQVFEDYGEDDADGSQIDHTNLNDRFKAQYMSDNEYTYEYMQFQIEPVSLNTAAKAATTAAKAVTKVAKKAKTAAKAATPAVKITKKQL